MSSLVLLLGLALAQDLPPPDDPAEAPPPSGASRGPGKKGDKAEDGPPSRPAPDAGQILPDPPASALVGGAASRFDEPSSAADLAASAGSFFDSSGKLVPGGAVEIGVRAFGLARRTSAAEYRASPGKRLWANTFLSLATAQDPDTGDLLGAVGGRVTLWQASDPYLAVAYREAVRGAAAAQCDADLRGNADPQALVDRGACIEAEYRRRAGSLREVAWNQSGTVLSVASSLRFPEGRLSQGGGHDAAAWLSQTVRAGDDTQIGVAAGWSQALGAHPHVASATGLVRGALGRTRLKTELGVELVLPHGPDERAAWARYPLLVGGEYRVGQGAWISMDLGFKIDPGLDQVGLLSRGTFRWGNMKAPTFRPEGSPEEPHGGG